MEIERINEGFSKFLEGTIAPEEYTIEDAKEVVADYPIEYLVPDYDLTEIAESLAEELGCKIYSDNGRHYLVKNVKGMPNIDEKSSGLDFSKESNCEAVNSAVELFGERLAHEYGDDFVIVGRMGGYWGLTNPEAQIVVSGKGYEKLAEILLEEYKEKGYTEEDTLGDYLYYNDRHFGELLQEDFENFEFNKEYKENMESLINSIKEEEKQMNSKEYWDSFHLD